MTIKQTKPRGIKQVTAQFDVVNPTAMQVLKTVAALPDAKDLAVFGDLVQGNTNASIIGLVLLAIDCKTLGEASAKYATHQTILVLERLRSQSQGNMQLFILMKDQQLLDYDPTKGWGVAQVSRIVRDRITINCIPVLDFFNVVSASVEEAELDGTVPAPDWVHILTNKLSKLPEVDTLRLFGSAVTMTKTPNDLDVAVLCDFDDWEEAQNSMSDLLFDLQNLKESGWLGEYLDIYVCLTESAYKWNEVVGDWTPIDDGKQLSADVRSHGVPVPKSEHANLTNATPKRRRLKTDPEHRQARIDYKKKMKNPAARRAQKIVRKKYVKKNKPKLQRKADTYSAWRSRQTF